MEFQFNYWPSGPWDANPCTKTSAAPRQPRAWTAEPEEEEPSTPAAAVEWEGFSTAKEKPPLVQPERSQMQQWEHQPCRHWSVLVLPSLICAWNHSTTFSQGHFYQISALSLQCNLLTTNSWTGKGFVLTQNQLERILYYFQYSVRSLCDWFLSRDRVLSSVPVAGWATLNTPLPTLELRHSSKITSIADQFFLSTSVIYWDYLLRSSNSVRC